MRTDDKVMDEAINKDRIGQKTKLLLIILCTLYVVYHFATLIYSPLPWFDEVSFLSMTESYMTDGTLYEKVRILGEPAQKLNYGPIYFVWQSFMIKTFGFGIFTARVTNLIFGFFCLVAVAVIALKLNFKYKQIIGILAFIALEPNFNQFLHSGRMDFIGLLFFLIAYVFFLGGNVTVGKIKIIHLIITGLFLCCSVLTNPRFVFAFPVFIAYFIYDILVANRAERLRVLINYTIILMSFIVLYYYWLWDTFGGLVGYIEYTKKASYLKDHLGVGAKFKIRYNLLLLIYAVLVVVILFVRNIWRKHIHIIMATLPAIISFALVVNGGIEGRYFAIVVPFLALLLFSNDALFNQFRIFKLVNATILAFFLAIFLFKSTYILYTIPQHDPYENELLITKYIKPNKSVFGDFEYYYIAKNKGCSFQTTQMNGTLDELTNYLLTNKTTYVILKKDNTLLPDYKNAFLDKHYQFVAEVDAIQSSDFFKKIIMKLPYKISDNYSCVIYRYKEDY